MMGHAHWLVLRKPLIPSSTACHPLPPCFSIFCTGKTGRIVGSYVWEGQPSKSNDAGGRSRVSLKFSTLQYMSYSSCGHVVALFTIGIVEIFRGPMATPF